MRPAVRLAAARLYLVTPAAPAAGPLERFVAAVLEGGVDVVQLREKHMEARELLHAADVVRRRTAEAGALFVVNDRIDLAIAAGADGVHLGQGDLPPGEARRQAGPGILVGLSTHTRAEVDSAAAGWREDGAVETVEVADRVDYIGVGPVHATPTKPGRPAVGTALVRHAAAVTGGLPFFAIGGVDRRTLPVVLEAGATRVCVLRALVEAEDPGREARALRALLDGAPGPAPAPGSASPAAPGGAA